MALDPRLALLALSLAAAGCATSTTDRLHLPPLRTVEKVELPRYLGTWYEIAAFPQRFQEGCTATMATYALREDGDVDVLNRCHDGAPAGTERSARGRARVVDRATGAKLEVSFFRPFWGAYWVIDLDPDYRWAVVGHPGRDYLWILARAPALDEGTYAAILRRLSVQRYDTARLVRTRHPAAPARD
jgi:apolipoprotein D and lipocalin family protein